MRAELPESFRQPVESAVVHRAQLDERSVIRADEAEQGLGVKPFHSAFALPGSAA
jgi:hypothetical protein